MKSEAETKIESESIKKQNAEILNLLDCAYFARRKTASAVFIIILIIELGESDIAVV